MDRCHHCRPQHITACMKLAMKYLNEFSRGLAEKGLKMVLQEDGIAALLLYSGCEQAEQKTSLQFCPEYRRTHPLARCLARMTAVRIFHQSTQGRSQRPLPCGLAGRACASTRVSSESGFRPCGTVFGRIAIRDGVPQSG